jgi:hypothetical protein
MLIDRPAEQMTLFKEIMFKKLTVREAEAIARKIAHDRVRKKERAFDPELVAIEEKFKESLGTRVHIERKDTGGKLTIDFFSADDLRDILERVTANGVSMGLAPDKMEAHIQGQNQVQSAPAVSVAASTDAIETAETAETAEPIDDRSKEEVDQDDNSDDELYSMKNFVV